MEKLKSVGSVLLTLGILSILLSLVHLQIKGMDIFGQYKRYVEIGSIVIGVVILIITKVFDKGKNDTEDHNK
ncbi:hypothetical protein [Lachnoclostridium phytofermentans]|uniref:hypothetical protein n=1 Tax=Lachnoclostridium phytofermentans TaxID=66219 RepID=UPI000317005A|nr:hypothetical protein [Lachnoclostridium phytofermentans]